MASNSNKELEQWLVEAGKKLVSPPASVDQLLPLLHQVESSLSRVEQSPTKSMQSTLTPLMNALVVDKLFRHSNIDVKVAVAACLSEITRITAPDAPYGDYQMKDVFQLIVSSFENLADKSSRTYDKRVSILETLALVRSCVVMLDLECDELIIEMFQHFFKVIRDYHPENVFSSMKAIMSLVLEESDDISVELLSVLLANLKKGDEEVLPVARMLGEKVLESCATKVKPQLVQTVKTLGISLDDYSDIVGAICQEISGRVEQNGVQAGDENKVEESKPVEAFSYDAAQNDEVVQLVSLKQVDPANDRPPKSAVSNGVILIVEDDFLADSDSLNKQEDSNHAHRLKGIDMPGNTEPGISDAEKVVDIDNKAEQPTKEGARKSQQEESGILAKDQPCKSIVYEDALKERDTTILVPTDEGPSTAHIEQHRKRLKRYLDMSIESIFNDNELSNMAKAVDGLYHFPGDALESSILGVLRQQLIGLQDKIHSISDSINSANAELDSLRRQNPDLSAMLNQETLALQAAESRLSELRDEEISLKEEIQKLTVKQELVLSQIASAEENVEKMKQKMAELKNTDKKIKTAASNCFKWQTEMSVVNASTNATFMNAKRVLFE